MINCVGVVGADDIIEQPLFHFGLFVFISMKRGKIKKNQDELVDLLFHILALGV